MAELPREGCAFEDVWRLRDCDYAGKSWLSSTRAPKVGLYFGSLPCYSTISSTLAQSVQQFQPTKS